MDLAYILSLIHSGAYVLSFLVFFLILALWRGRYVLINLILSFNLALLLTLQFPYFDKFFQGGTQTTIALVKITIFLVFTTLGFFVFRRHIPGNDYEKMFEGFWQKILLSVMATALVMIISYQVLPLSDLIQLPNPLQNLFTNQANFFWWLLIPLLVLFFV